MMRITIRLRDDQAAALEREGERRQMAMSEIARDAIAIHLAHLGADRIVDGKRDIPFAGISRSGHTDISERIDEILAEEWTKENLVDRNRGDTG